MAMMAMMTITDLYSLQLTDGLPVEMGGQTVRYKLAHLRETAVADERYAVQAAERAIQTGGRWQLLVSDYEYRLAMDARHIERLSCSGLNDIPQAAITIETLGKLSTHDLSLLEERIVLIELAAQVRYGLISEAEFNAILAAQDGDNGEKTAAHTAPQSDGEAVEPGDTDPEPRPRPKLLADHSRTNAAGTSVTDGNTD